MSEELEAAKETAKAVQEVAKAVPTVIEAGSELARWAGHVMGTVPEDIVGLAIGDYLNELRHRNIDRIRRRTDEILRNRRIEEPRTIRPRVAIPFFEAASEESDETLQEIWARLLANSMDPSRQVDLRRQFIGVLKQFEPFDVQVFQMLSDAEHQTIQELGPIVEALGARQTQVQVAVDHLSNLNCVTFPEASGRLRMTPLGHEIRLALAVDGSD